YSEIAAARPSKCCVTTASDSISSPVGFRKAAFAGGPKIKTRRSTQWRARLSELHGQLFPMAQPVLQRLAQIRVRFYLAVRELPLDPILQFLHHRPALFLMVGQTPLIIHLRRLGLVSVDLADHIQDYRASGRVIFPQFKDLPSGVRQTISPDHI